MMERFDTYIRQGLLKYLNVITILIGYYLSI